MIGSLDQSDKEATVIGGGAAGLFASYGLVKAGFRVRLLEKTERLGGLLGSVESEYGLVERAANSLMLTPALSGLAKDIGIELISIAPGSDAKYILRDGRLRRMPLNFFEILEAVDRMCFVPVKAGSYSCREFAERHLGNAAADYLMEPMVTGIYGARASELDWELCFPHLKPRKGYSVLADQIRRRFFPSRGELRTQKRIIVAPRFGMQSLVDRLVEFLRRSGRVEFLMGTDVKELPDAPNMVIATEASAAARFFGGTWDELARNLAEVSYAPLITVGVFIRKRDLKNMPGGLGVLIPPREGRRVLGILFSSSCFPERVHNASEHCLVTVMMGGTAQKNLMNHSEYELRDIVKSELDLLFGLRGEPLAQHIHQWPQAIPIYGPALRNLWRVAQEIWCQKDGRILFGNYTGEVSLRAMLEQASGF